MTPTEYDLRIDIFSISNLADQLTTFGQFLSIVNISNKCGNHLFWLDFISTRKYTFQWPILHKIVQQFLAKTYDMTVEMLKAKKYAEIRWSYERAIGMIAKVFRTILYVP